MKVFCLIAFLSIGLRNCSSSKIYKYTTELKELSEHYDWEEIKVSIIDHEEHNKFVENQKSLFGIIDPSFFTAKSVYVTLTTISGRVNKVNETLITLLRGKIVPTHIYLFLSREPYLLDKGVIDIPDGILSLAAEKYVTIVYTNNNGPHRKLLPLLSYKWRSDCLIATVDDDMGLKSNSDVIYRLLKTYNKTDGNSVIALRARRIGVCLTTPFRSTAYYHWMISFRSERTEMLLMPTGTGGVLYRPSFFHPIVFNKKLRQLTGTADDLMFRLAVMSRNVSVTVGCYTIKYRGRVLRTCKKDKLDTEFDAYSMKIRVASLPRLLTQDNISNFNNLSINGNFHDNQESRKLKSVSEMPDLFSINRQGSNDRAWNSATKYLKTLNILDFSRLIEENYFERESRCYNLTKMIESKRSRRLCSVVDCEHLFNSNSTTADTIWEKIII